MGKITMKEKELELTGLFHDLVNNKVTQQAVADELGRSVRQIRNKLKAFKKEGPASLAHKNRGRPSKRKLDREVESRVIEILRSEDWPEDCGPTFASEKLQEIHEIIINREGLRKIMMKSGLWSGRKAKTKRRKQRERKRRFGAMIQLD